MRAPMQEKLFGKKEGTTPAGWPAGSGITITEKWLADPERRETEELCISLEAQAERRIIRAYGKELPRPRATAWMAESGRSYTYGGETDKCIGWPTKIAELAERISQDEAWIGGGGKWVVPNGVLLNVYEGGRDSVSWHADDEPEIRGDQPIASLSLGATRLFKVRHRDTKRKAAGGPLQGGSLLVMPAGFQKEWVHCVPKTTKNIGKRWNLTFRVYR